MDRPLLFIIIMGCPFIKKKKKKFIDIIEIYFKYTGKPEKKNIYTNKNSSSINITGNQEEDIREENYTKEDLKLIEEANK